MAKNEALGYIDCDRCDGRAEVCQTKRGAGRFLYTRCVACGTDQRAGAAVQSRLWRGTDWIDGAPDVKPPNVAESLGSETEPGAASEPKSEPKSEPLGVQSGSGSGFAWIVGGAVAVIALLVGRSPR